MSTLAATNLKHESSASNNIVLTSGGDVGIGTSSPAGKLDILTGTYRGYFDDAAGSLFRLNGVNAANSAYGPMSLNGSVLTFQTSASERMRIDSSGNVGIGTSSPSQKLEVFASANSLQIESIVRNDQSGTGVAAIGFNVSSSAAAETTSTKAGIGLVRSNAYGVGSLCFYNSGTTSAGNFTTSDERMRIDSSGNVGIGTSSPSTGIANRILAINGTDAGINFLVSGTDTSRIYTSSGEFRLHALTAIPLVFYTNNTERARIDSSGLLLVGTTIGLSGHTFQNSSGASTYRPTTTSGFGIHHFYSDVSGTGSLKAYVQADGTYINASDEKLKTNIVKARSYLNDLMRIEIVNYTWKGGEDNEKKLGVIAQQVESVFPSLVKEVIGNPATGETQKMLPQEVFIPMLITAIQELKADFDAYKAAHP